MENSGQCKTCIMEGSRLCNYHGYTELPKYCEYKIGTDAEMALINLQDFIKETLQRMKKRKCDLIMGGVLFFTGDDLKKSKGHLTFGHGAEYFTDESGENVLRADMLGNIGKNGTRTPMRGVGSVVPVDVWNNSLMGKHYPVRR